MDIGEEPQGELAKSIFLDALEIVVAADREAYVDRRCGLDPSLRAEVETLLRHHEGLGDYLERPAIDRTADRTMEVRPIVDGPGAVIGPYKLLQKIGEGGMGTVYVAEQTAPVRRTVAVKIIKPGMDSRQVLSRFEAERQALALMDHPNIAKVLDAGTTALGRPYFVMELVKGRPITLHCDERRLSPRERLELFIPVCQAVQHAHQKGIIHRDIKPGNVLVALYDGRPVPKVIDFGVAKAVGQKLTEETLFTGFGHVVGTPEYMSPEQAELNQLDIDTRSDIYSLGVLLYELLTGTTPLQHRRIRDVAILEVLRLIREDEAPRPSQRLSSTEELPSIAANRGIEPRRLSGLVAGDLDWIVMKALEKDRNRRYETSNGLAADVQRYLDDQPVQACPPSASYRIRKFARRNKRALATAFVIGMAALLAVGSLGWVVRDRLARQAKVAGQVELILGEVDRLVGEQKWTEALAATRRAEAAVTSGEADGETAEHVRRRLKDLTFIDRLDQIRMQRSTIVEGVYDNVAADREYARAFREYGVDADELAVETSIDRLKARPALAIPLAAALDDWVFGRRVVSDRDASAWKRLVAIARGIDPEPLRDRLRSSWGEPVTPESRTELQRLVDSIDVRAQHPATVATLVSTLRRAKQSDVAIRCLRAAQNAYPADFKINLELGNALSNEKNYEGAIRFYTAAVAIRPNSTVAYSKLGNALRRHGRLDEANSANRKAIQLDSKYAPAYSALGDALLDQRKLDESIAAHRRAIELDSTNVSALVHLGSALRDQKKLDEAIAVQRKASELDPKNAHAYYEMGISLMDQGKLDEAIAACRKATDIEPKNASARTVLGIALHHQGTVDDPIAQYRKAIEIDPKMAAAYVNLGLSLLVQKKFDEAVDACQTAIELDPKMGSAHRILGIALRSKGKLDESIAALKQASELNPQDAAAYYNLGLALRDLGKLDEAIAAHKRAFEIDPKNTPEHNRLGIEVESQGKLDEAITAYKMAITVDPNNAAAYSNLGIALRNQGKLDEAIAPCRKSVEVDPNYAPARNNFGLVLMETGKLDEAIVEYKKAIELSPDYVVAHNNLGLAFHRQRKLDEAIAEYRKAIELEPRYANAHTNLGAALYDQGKLDEAIEVYHTLIKLDPKNYYVLGRLGTALAVQGKVDEAAAVCREAIRLLELHPQSPKYLQILSSAMQCLGHAQYRAGAWRESIESLEKSCELQPGGTGDCGQWIVLALAHARLSAEDGLTDPDREQHKLEARRRYEEASKQVDQWGARTRDEFGQVIWDFREEAAELLGLPSPSTIRRDKVTEFLRRRAELDERVSAAKHDSVVRWKLAKEKFQLAANMRDLNELSMSEAVCREVLGALLKLESKDTSGFAFQYYEDIGWANHLLSDVLVRMGRSEEAEAIARESVRRFQALAKARPDVPGYHDALAIAYWPLATLLGQLNRVEEAGQVQETQSSARKEAEQLRTLPSVQAVMEAARPFAQKREWKQAAAELNKGFEHQTRSDAFLRYSTALARLLSADVDGYVRLAAGMPSEQLGRGEAFDLVRTRTLHPGGVGDPVALVALARALCEGSTDCWGPSNLGMAHYRAGEYDKALERLEEATRLADWYIYWPGLAMAHHQLGHSDEARQLLDKANAWLRHVTETGAEPLKVTNEQAWQDWAYFEVMLSEANSLIDGENRRKGN